MDGQEVEVGVEACEDRVFFAVFDEVGRGRCEEMRAVERLVMKRGE